jgi:hypothetical protein
MNRFWMKLNIVIVFLFLSLYSSSQNYNDDAQLWVNIYLEKSISKKMDIHLNQQDRFVNNIMQFGLAYADIGLTYKFNKNIKVLADYVLIEKKRNDGNYKIFHQYYLALIAKKDIGYWRFSYRNMFQCQYNSPFTSNTGYIPYYYDRNKVTVKYEATKRLSFYVAEEVNIPLNNPQVKGLSRTRSFAGMFINTHKHQQLELYYMFQVQLQQGNWYKQDISYPNTPLNRLFVLGIGYQIQF